MMDDVVRGSILFILFMLLTTCTQLGKLEKRKGGGEGGGEPREGALLNGIGGKTNLLCPKVHSKRLQT